MEPVDYTWHRFYIIKLSNVELYMVTYIAVYILKHECLKTLTSSKWALLIFRSTVKYVSTPLGYILVQQLTTPVNLTFSVRKVIGWVYLS